MSWRRSADGFDLLSNRDEARTRPRAELPSVRSRGGIRWIAPRDPQGGGSWIAVNQWGLALTLLNGDRDGELPPGGPAGFRSRGLLIDELATLSAVPAVAARLEQLDLGPFRAFGLLALDRGGDVLAAGWERGVLDLRADPRPPLASSSFRPTVRGVRERLWADSVGAAVDLEAMLDFHRSHRPERGPDSPCMHRPVARTVSFSWIAVGGGEAIFRYADGPPCRTPALERARLEVRSVP